MAEVGYCVCDETALRIYVPMPSSNREVAAPRPSRASERATRSALAALSQRQRLFVTLQIVGHSRIEIATHSGATPRIVDRQLARARRYLRLVRDPD